MSLRKIADKLKSEEQKLQMASEDADDDDDDIEGNVIFVIFVNDNYFMKMTFYCQYGVQAFFSRNTLLCSFRLEYKFYK